MRRLRTKERETKDSGFTLIELLVAMGIFAIVLTISIAGIVAITQNLRKSTNTSAEAGQLQRAFLRMDKSVRYASSIGQPGQTGSNYYVEFESTSDNKDVCTQWRLQSSTGQLQVRTWQPKYGYTSATAWNTVATGIVNNLSTQPPFTMNFPSGAVHQQLDVNLLGKRGGNPAGSAQTKVSLVARNSGADSLASPCDPDHSRS